MDGRRFMESYCDQTLRGMSRGRAGEPSHVVSLARSILRVRGIENECNSPAFPPSVKTEADRTLFDSLVARIGGKSKAERHAAILLLQNRFGYNWHKEAGRS